MFKVVEYKGKLYGDLKCFITTMEAIYNQGSEINMLLPYDVYKMWDYNSTETQNFLKRNYIRVDVESPPPEFMVEQMNYRPKVKVKLILYPNRKY